MWICSCIHRIAAGGNRANSFGMDLKPCGMPPDFVRRVDPTETRLHCHQWLLYLYLETNRNMKFSSTVTSSRRKCRKVRRDSQKGMWDGWRRPFPGTVQGWTWRYSTLLTILSKSIRHCVAYISRFSKGPLRRLHLKGAVSGLCEDWWGDSMVTSGCLIFLKLYLSSLTACQSGVSRMRKFSLCLDPFLTVICVESLESRVWWFLTMRLAWLFIFTIVSSV